MTYGDVALDVLREIAEDESVPTDERIKAASLLLSTSFAHEGAGAEVPTKTE